MDLVIRGRSQDQHWSEAMGHGEDQSGARQDRTRGRGRTRVEPGSTGAEGAQEQEAAAADVGGFTPEGARGKGQGSSRVRSSLMQQFQSKQASDEGGTGRVF